MPPREHLRESREILLGDTVRTSVRLLVPFVLVTVLALPPITRAQATGQPQAAPPWNPTSAGAMPDAGLVSLGAVVTPSGAKDAIADVPLMYQPAPDVTVRKLQADVTFVGDTIQFVAAMPPADAPVKLEVTATTKELPPDPAGDSREKRTQVSVTVTVVGDATAVLPQGTVAVLDFKVPAKTAATSVWLDVARLVAERQPGTTVALKVEPGRVIVTKYEETINFVGSCFFYMH